MPKSSMVRVDPHVAQMLDALAVAMMADPEMVAKYGDSSGHISRSELYRECVSRGYASLRQQVRVPDPVAPPAPVDKPMDKPATKKKPAPKAKKRRK